MPDTLTEEQAARLDDMDVRLKAAVIALEASPDLARKIITLADEKGDD